MQIFHIFSRQDLTHVSRPQIIHDGDNDYNVHAKSLLCRSEISIESDRRHRRHLRTQQRGSRICAGHTPSNRQTQASLQPPSPSSPPFLDRETQARHCGCYTAIPSWRTVTLPLRSVSRLRSRSARKGSLALAKFGTLKLRRFRQFEV
jgi:hypothetical protein